MTTPDMKELKAILDWVNVTEDIRELSLRSGDVELHISKDGTRVAPLADADQRASGSGVRSSLRGVAKSPSPLRVEEPGSDTASLDDELLASDEVVIKSPMVGVFYSASGPGAPAFVNPGDRVQVDTVLGIVEVMKLMNNIEAKIAGEVVQILVRNEQAVEFGQPLMVIKRSA